MAQAGDKRKLATILAIDIAGYSAASERDQGKAAENVRLLRARASELAAAANGRIFNTAGDGLMLEFPVASSAVRAALVLAEEAVAAAGTKPRLRQGVHLGEVIVSGEDLLGHGVNVAARLMQRATPNGVVISDTVKTQLHGETDARFEPCGRVRLSKMRETVNAFECLPGASEATKRWRRARRPLLAAAAALAVAAIGLGAWRLWPQPPATPFVAVLPFDNISSDPTLTYFSEGVSAEIQATLARYQQGLRVAGLASGFRFHGAEKDPTHVRQAMGATHIVDGSVRRDGDVVRIVAELVDTRNGAVLWTKTYDRDLGRTLETQADIARQVGHMLHAAAPDIVAPPALVPSDALEHYLHGVDELEELIFSSTSVDEAGQDLEQATQAAPRFARAWALLSVAYAAQSRRRNEDEQAQLLRRARDAAGRALALDGRLALAEAMLARTEPEWSWQSRRRHYERALALSPNDVRVLNYWRDFLARTGRVREARSVNEQMLQLDPLSEDSQRDVVSKLFDAREAEGAMRAVERLTAQDEHSAPLWLGVFENRVNANDLAGARRGLREVERHLAGIARDMRWSQQRADAVMTQYRSELDTLAHHPLTREDGLRIAQQDFERVTGVNVGQGCVTDEIRVVASRGRVDLAWRMAETLYIERGYVGTTDTCNRPVYPDRQAATWPLFAPGSVTLWRDPRVWRIFDAVGLTRYWRETNSWPDFCSEPSLPYDCRLVAAQSR